MALFSVSNVLNEVSRGLGSNSASLSVVTSSDSVVSTTMTLVLVGDIDGTNYVTGSEGNYKTIVEKDGAGVTLKTTTLKYENATYPTKVTKVTVV